MAKRKSRTKKKSKWPEHNLKWIKSPPMNKDSYHYHWCNSDTSIIEATDNFLIGLKVYLWNRHH